MSFPLHLKLPALARAFVWILGLSKETLFIWHILIVNGIPESVKAVLGWLLWACLDHIPSVLHLLFEVRLCLFYYLHLWHSSHYSVVIITVTVRSGLHSAWLLSAPLQRPVSGSCYCGFMSRKPIRAPSLAVQWSTSFFTIKQFRLCAVKNFDCLLLQCHAKLGPAHVVLTFKNNRHLQ